MFVNSISIRREGYYQGYSSKADHTKPFLATIEVAGQNGKVELNLSPELSAKIFSIIAEEVAAAGRATAEAMVASCLDVAPQKAIAA